MGSRRDLRSDQALQCAARRSSSDFQRQRSPNGYRLCFWCTGEVTNPRRTHWCSEACVEQFREQSWPNYLDRKVFERDQGICRLCGLDTVRVEAEVRRQFSGPDAARLRHRVLVAYGLVEDRQVGPSPVRCDEHDWPVYRMLDRLGLPLVKRLLTSQTRPWEVDHIVPIAEGGEHSLTNLRILCYSCHVRETAELRRRLRKVA